MSIMQPLTFASSSVGLFFFITGEISLFTLKETGLAKLSMFFSFFNKNQESAEHLRLYFWEFLQVLLHL